MITDIRAVKHPDSDVVHFAITKGHASFAMFLTREEIVRLKEVIENATK